MKTVTLFFPGIVMLFFLSSCNNIIFVQKTYDPEIVLEPELYKIAFVNIFDYTSQAYVREKQEKSYHAGVMKLIEGLSSQFSKSKTLSFLPVDTLRKDIKEGQLTAFLPKDTIYSICERYNSDLLLTLDSLNIFIDWETIYNNDGGGKEKEFYLITRFYLSLYSATGNLINRSMVEESSLYKTRAALSSLITIKPSIANAVEAIKSLSLQAGQDYVGKFYPKTINEQRELYTGKVFKESNLFIKLRNWNKAAELLDQLANSPDPKIAMKARHNFSVLKEMAELEKQ
jgi:hypothetical protein